MVGPSETSLSERVAVIVMAFNEAVSLEAVVREIHEVLCRLGGSHEIVIVDDGSSDGTGEKADRLANELRAVRVIHHETNRGLGGVYRTGFAAVRRDFVTFFPADGQFPASIIEQFVPLMDDADMVLGYLPSWSCSMSAKVLSRGERILYRLLIGPFPRFQGIVMFRREILDGLELKSTGRGWAVLMELIFRASQAGWRIRSVPTEIRPRMSGVSKVQNFRVILSNFQQILALRRDL